MATNPLLKNINEAHVAIALTGDVFLPSNFTDVLNEMGAKIVRFTVGDDGSSTVILKDVVIAPSKLKLSKEMTEGQVLRWKRGKIEKEEPGVVDIDSISANTFAEKVARLLESGKFKLPTWLQESEYTITKGNVEAIERANTGKLDFWKKDYGRCQQIIITGGTEGEFTELWLTKDGKLLQITKIPAFEKCSGIREISKKRDDVRIMATKDGIPSVKGIRSLKTLKKSTK